MSDRLFEALEEGTPREKRITRGAVEKGIRQYYEAMAWNPNTGVPTEGRLGYLGLDWVNGGR